jgi:hypothetical protein
MGCTNWNDEWVAELYDELDVAESARLHAHLGECSACRATLDGLAATRSELQQNAGEVPLAPRVVLLPSRPLRQPVWAFAAGLAFALILFSGGIFAGRQIQRVSGTTAEPQTISMTEVEAALARQQSEIDDRFSAMEAVQSPADSSTADPSTLSRNELETELAELRRKLELSQTRDFEFLLGEINRTEARAGSWANETRQALQYVMLANNPDISDR